MKSKTLAEKFAWDFVKKHNNPFEFVTIAPAMTVGPLLNPRLPTSMMVIASIMDRIYPLLPKINWKLCDVRDVATGHVNALTSKAANGNRYIIVNATMWTSDVAMYLNYEYGPKGFSVSQTTGPYWVIWLASFFDPLVTDFVLPQYGKLRLSDSSPAIKDLSVVYINARDMLLDATNSLIHHKLIQIPKSFEQNNKAKL
ncbi:hypothetical protein RFI_28618 [Reticulomyxa filosa]|uniref:Uncharacterized protein n=1 Tax=Reticulomyxa filosa TaxID=46433 RepID=X6M565_RETFI|nr:hypothetical protein RFI_28618 [Reticulomyxa filosa]|eukprot:ETO08771.1 hypothetical protein RFI_28618 [Reticulomyxa filosa]